MEDGPLRTSLWEQIRIENADQQTGHKQRQLQADSRDATVQHHAGDDADVDGQERCQEGGHVDIPFSRYTILHVIDWVLQGLIFWRCTWAGNLKTT